MKTETKQKDKSYSHRHTISGFTLMELVVVISMIVAILSIFLVNYRAGGSNQSLNLAAQKLAFDIKKAQSLTIAGVNIKSSDTPKSNCGYGINISSEPAFEYKIFLDNNCNNKYEASDTEIERIELPHKIQVLRFSTSPPSSLDITFNPPRPTTSINNNQNTTSVDIVLNIEDDPLAIKTISVTTGGQINIYYGRTN